MSTQDGNYENRLYLVDELGGGVLSNNLQDRKVMPPRLKSRFTENN